MISREESRRLARALCDELAYTASEELKLAVVSGLFTPKLQEQMTDVAWRALEVSELASYDDF